MSLEEHRKLSPQLLERQPELLLMPWWWLNLDIVSGSQHSGFVPAVEFPSRPFGGSIQFQKFLQNCAYIIRLSKRFTLYFVVNQLFFYFIIFVISVMHFIYVLIFRIIKERTLFESFQPEGYCRNMVWCGLKHSCWSGPMHRKRSSLQSSDWQGNSDWHEQKTGWG